MNEACAAGLPVLGSRTAGACQELVREGVNGLLFDPQSASEIVKSLTAIHSTSQPDRLRMGQRANKLSSTVVQGNSVLVSCKPLNVQLLKSASFHWLVSTLNKNSSPSIEALWI